MASSPIPAHVLTFINEHIHSVEQLEILLLMRARGGEWTASALALELRISELSARSRLSDLAARGFLKSTQREAYHYDPNDEPARQAITGLAACYAQFRVRVIETIFSTPRAPTLGAEETSAHILAEAFRITKKEDK